MGRIKQIDKTKKVCNTIKTNHIRREVSTKMKLLIAILIAAFLVTTFCKIAICDEDAAQNLLKQGLLGAATGAVASEASGGKAGKGALVGAGVNIVGGVLFDAMSGKKVAQTDTVQSMTPTDAFQQGYQSGYESGFDKGYSEGYQSALKTTRQ